MNEQHCSLRIGTRGFPPLCAMAALSLLAGMAPQARAQQDDSVEFGRESLAKRRYPWYEPQKEAPRPLRVGKKSDTTSGAKPATPGSSSGSSSSSSGGIRGFGVFGSLVQVLGLLALTAVLAAVAALIAWAFLRNETTATQGARVVAASKEVDRVEQLPFALKRTGGDFLSEARRLAEEGNYSEAIIYLYSFLLVQLDKHHVIRLAKGKTNRQYLRETRMRPLLAEILETTMIAFEDVFFGHHDLARERFEECISQVEAFQADLVKLERAAA